MACRNTHECQVEMQSVDQPSGDHIWRVLQNPLRVATAAVDGCAYTEKSHLDRRLTPGLERQKERDETRDDEQCARYVNRHGSSQVRVQRNDGSL